MPNKPLIVANWKMELSHKAALEVTRSLKSLAQHTKLGAEVVICPSYPSLEAVGKLLGESNQWQVGVQNIHWEERGAVTGQVSILQIQHLARWSIVGHSEQRALTGETEEEIQKKVALCLKHGLAPIVCLGEDEQERADDQTVARITYQVKKLLAGIDRSALSKVVIAYEPIWAIGTGDTPEPSEVASIMLLIRKIVTERFEEEAARRLRTLYGGSVTATGAKELAAEPGVDGFLVGGASIHPLEFLKIIENFTTHYVS